MAFSFDVNDGTTSTANTADLTIDPVNDAPDVTPVSLGSIDEDGFIVITQADLLTGASDADGDALVADDLAVTSGNGTLINHDDGTWTFVPDADWNGDVAFSFFVVDSETFIANTASLTVDPVNDVPVTPAALSSTVDEDAAAYSIDLLSGTTDADADTLAVTNFTLVSGDASGLSLNGTNLDVDPNTYTSLAVGDADVVVVFDYDIDDGNGGVVAQSVTVTITPENDAPTVTSAITSTVGEETAAYSLDLLAGASDVDTGDTVSISGVTITNDPAGAVTLNGTNVDVDPSVYRGLNETQSQVVTVNYSVVDGNGGSVAQTATITINGEDDVPTISGDTSRTLVEDAASSLVASGDLNTAGGDDGEDVFVANTVSGAYGEFTVDEAGTWSYTAPNSHNAIQGLRNSSETLTETFTVTNADGVTTQDITITIQGSDNGVPDILVEDSDISVTTGTLDHDFSRDDFDFGAQDDASDASGVDPSDLTLESESNVTVTFISEAAGYDNSLGWYQIDEVGRITNVGMIFANANDLTAGDSVTLSGVSEGEIGFFLMQNGYALDMHQDAIDAQMSGTGFMRFENGSGERATIYDDAPELYYYPSGDEDNPDGDYVPMRTTFHTSYQDLNADGYVHSDSGIDSGDNNTLVIGFEDLLEDPDYPGGVDWDLRDLVFSVEITSVTQNLAAVASTLDIVDDGTELSAASVRITVGRESDDLVLSDATEALADSYGIDVSYDADARTLNFSGDASISNYEEVLSAVQIASTNDLGENPRQIEFNVTDTDGLTSSVALVNLNADPSYDFSQDDYLAGSTGDDSLAGLVGNDALAGGVGSDTLSGGTGSDTFLWFDEDASGSPQDIIADFTQGAGGDVLDFSDLLEGESAQATVLDDYFAFSSDGTDTTISIDTNGDGSGTDMSVVLEGVDLTLLGGDQAILQSLLDNGNLITD